MAGIPRTANRRSMAARTPDGAWMRPAITPTELASSLVVALATIVGVRVWGTGAGKAPRPTSMRTPNIWARSPMASAYAFQRRSGSGPASTSTSWPFSSRPGAELDRVPAEVLVHAVDDDGDRAAGPVVEQLVGVEGGHQLGGNRLLQGGEGPAATEPGVDPTFGREDQHGVVQRRPLVQFVEPGTLVHGDQGTFRQESGPRPRG